MVLLWVYTKLIYLEFPFVVSAIPWWPGCHCCPPFPDEYSVMESLLSALSTPNYQVRLMIKGGLESQAKFLTLKKIA